MIELKLISGGSYLVTDLEIEALKSTFPAVDIAQELREMANWLDANPSNRKTDKGIKRFIHNWLGKAQDRAPRSGATAAPPVLPHEEDPQTDGRAEWLLAECKSRGLVPEAWQPKGDNPRERYSSIRSKATCGFHEQHPDDNRDVIHRGPTGPLWGDDLREAQWSPEDFGQILLRAAESDFPAQSDPRIPPDRDLAPEMPMEPLPSIPGFTRSGDIVRGDFESVLEGT